MKALPGVAERIFGRRLTDEVGAGDHLKNIVDSDRTEQLVRLSILHEIRSNFLHQPQVNHENGDERKGRAHKRERVDVII